MKKFKLADLVENFSVRAKNVGGSEGLEFLGVSNENGITQSKYAAEDKAEDYKIIEKGCFAYNPYRINVGSIAYVSDNIKGLISPAYVIFKTKPNMVDDRLLLKFLKSAEGLRQIKLNARGSVRQALRFEDLCKIEINLPDYEKQVEFLNQIDIIDSCSNKVSSEITRQLDLIKNLRQAFLREAMQGVLVSNETSDGKTGADLLAEIQAEKAQLVKDKKIKKPKSLAPITEEELPFDIPENWTWCRLGEFGDLKRGKSKHRPRNDIRLFENGTIPFIQTGDVARSKTNKDIIDTINGYYNDFGLAQSELQPKGTLCITIAANIAESGFLGFDACLPDSIVCFDTEKEFSKRFVHYFIRLSKVEIERFAPATAQKNINLGILNDLYFPLPPLEIQEHIVAKLDELMGYCDALEEQVKQSRQTNELLLQHVLRETLGDKKAKVINTEIGVSTNKYVEVETNYDALVAETFGEYLPQKVNNINDTHKELAALVYLMNNGLGANYGNVAFQKAVYNSSVITPNLYSKKHDFVNYNFGTFSKELANDLTHNPYLKTKKVNSFEVYEIEPSKKSEILNVLSSAENKDFVSSINMLIDLYRLPFINKESNKMELLNTVLKIYSDLKTTDIEIIYQAMKDWKIKQTGFNTKAEKFTKQDTQQMIELLVLNHIL